MRKQPYSGEGDCERCGSVGRYIVIDDDEQWHTLCPDHADSMMEPFHSHQLDRLDEHRQEFKPGSITVSEIASKGPVCTYITNGNYCGEPALYDVLEDGRWRYDCLCHKHRTMGFKPSDLYYWSNRHAPAET